MQSAQARILGLVRTTHSDLARELSLLAARLALEPTERELLTAAARILVELDQRDGRATRALAASRGALRRFVELAGAHTVEQGASPSTTHGLIALELVNRALGKPQEEGKAEPAAAS